MGEAGEPGILTFQSGDGQAGQWKERGVHSGVGNVPLVAFRELLPGKCRCQYLPGETSAICYCVNAVLGECEMVGPLKLSSGSEHCSPWREPAQHKCHPVAPCR